MRCIVIDEDKVWADTIAAFIAKTQGIDLVALYRNPIDVMISQPDKSIDLMFIDTNLSYLNGIEMAQKLSYVPQTIFMSQGKSHAFDAFELKATDYLLKPFEYERFIRAIETAKERIRPKQNFEETVEVKTNTGCFWIKSDYHFVKIDLNDLLYIEGLKDYLKIYMKGKDKPCLPLGSLKKIEERLPCNQFFRIHRSYIVSIPNLDSVQRNMVRIGNAKLSIGEQYKARFFQSVIENSLI
jgi:DNA-binding LytR/AlgR family response regulator